MFVCRLRFFFCDLSWQTYVATTFWQEKGWWLLCGLKAAARKVGDTAEVFCFYEKGEIWAAAVCFFLWRCQEGRVWESSDASIRRDQCSIGLKTTRLVAKQCIQWWTIFLWVCLDDQILQSEHPFKLERNSWGFGVTATGNFGMVQMCHQMGTLRS